MFIYFKYNQKREARIVLNLTVVFYSGAVIVGRFQLLCEFQQLLILCAVFLEVRVFIDLVWNARRHLINLSSEYGLMT